MLNLLAHQTYIHIANVRIRNSDKKVYTVDQNIFGRKIFRRLNFRLALFSSLWSLNHINLLHLYVEKKHFVSWIFVIEGNRQKTFSTKISRSMVSACTDKSSCPPTKVYQTNQARSIPWGAQLPKFIFLHEANLCTNLTERIWCSHIPGIAARRNERPYRRRKRREKAWKEGKRNKERKR